MTTKQLHLEAKNGVYSTINALGDGSLQIHSSSHHKPVELTAEQVQQVIDASRCARESNLPADKNRCNVMTVANSVDLHNATVRTIVYACDGDNEIFELIDCPISDNQKQMEYDLIHVIEQIETQLQDTASLKQVFDWSTDDCIEQIKADIEYLKQLDRIYQITHIRI